MNATVPLSQRSLIHELNISNFIFNLNCQELEENLKKIDSGILIQRYSEGKESFIKLYKVSEGYLQALINYYLENSLGYQIVRVMYEHRRTTVTFLSEKFNTSEAVIYRKITEVNIFLETYDLKIKNGMITGDELKVCYFIYHYFLGSVSIDKLQQELMDNSLIKTINYLEEAFQQRFSIITRIQLRLWIKVLRHRSWITSDVSSLPINFPSQLTQDPIYRVARKTYFHLISQSAMGGNEFKAVYLYIFLSTMFVLSPKTMH